jgi:signal transduction histidine kinase/ligand-binding sensor domain-containing protein/CheY-like chemotaxis protein
MKGRTNLKVYPLGFAGFLCMLLHLAYTPTNAQRVALSLTPLHTSDHLSQNTIQCIYQDHFGFIWFGTQDGLNKYDGYRIEVFKHKSNDVNSLSANHITAISEDLEGNLWVGTRTGGLNKLDRAKNSFTGFQFSNQNPSSINGNQINVIFTDSQSNIWIGTSHGLSLLPNGSSRFERISLSSAGDQNARYDVRSIYQDRSKKIWIGTSTGLKVLQQGRLLSYQQRQVQRQDNTINSILEDLAGNIWLGTNSGLRLFNKHKGTFSSYAIDPDKNSHGGLNPVFCLLRAGGNRLWIGSNTTLQLFDATSKQIVPVADRTGGDSRMPNDGIYSLFQDKAQTLWIGTTSQGILKLDRNLTIFPSYRASLNNNASAENIIRGLAQDHSGNLYLATDAGMQYFDKVSSSYKNYTHQSQNRNSLSSNYTTSIVFSKKSGLVWIGTYSNGINVFNPKLGKFQHITTDTKRLRLSSNLIDVLLEDSLGRIWIGTDGGGLNMYDPASDTVSTYMYDRSRPARSPGDNTVLALCQDKKGNIWIGGYSKGISILNPIRNTFSHLNTQNSKLTSDVISCFHQDSQENMWIGTQGGGLNKYDSKTGTLTSFTDENGLINSSINYITADASGKLWISTNQGIVSFDPQKQIFRNFGKVNNLKAMEFNLGAGLRLSSGEIVMGSINGFNIIDPSRLSFNYNQPNVVFTGLQLFNKPVTVTTKKGPLKQTLLTSKTLALDYAQSVLTISFAALDFTSPENNQYAYILEGFDEDWNYIGNLHSASYTNLDPGKYVFKVKATNNDGIWSDKPASLVLLIKAPYWMTWWFKFVVILLLAAAGYTFYRYRLSFERKQKARLVVLVQQRTAKVREQASHLRKLNEALVQNASSLEALNIELQDQKAHEKKARITAELAQNQATAANSAKSTFLAAMSHELRTPINGVMGMASLLSETPLTGEQKEYANAILSSGQSLLGVVNDILDFSRIEAGNIELEEHCFELRTCLEDVLGLFGPKISESGIELLYLIEETVPAFVIADSLRLGQILTNLVGNAVKFTHRGEVIVQISLASCLENEMRLRFTVTDTGIGIPENQQANLFKPFHQLDASITRRYGGSGLGLVISERLVKTMNGKIDVFSEAGKGTTFNFEISCKKDGRAAMDIQGDSAAFNGKTVLIISENATSQKAIEGQIRSLKAHTVFARSRAQVEELMTHTAQVHVAIIDKGWRQSLEPAQWIRSLSPDLPVILLGHLKNEQQEGTDSLFSSILSKPVRQASLWRAIEDALNLGELPVESKKPILSEQFASQIPFEILIAEDILINQKLITWILNKLGYQPDLANNGIEVLQMMKTKKYDVILMDLQMPEMDGLEATRIIRQTYGDRPFIIALTANAMPEDRENCMNSKMNDFITKPINLELLTQSLLSLYSTAHYS